jgi:hypothetical protein
MTIGMEKCYSIERITRVSASLVEHAPIQHVSCPSDIDYPLTGDFQSGENDAVVDSLGVGESHTFIPQIAMHDTHILDRFAELSRDLRTSIRVRRVR